MASSSVAWMPTHGRHQINIGPSLGRAIRARKLKGSPGQSSSTTTTTTTKRSNLPERDFYAFRYNFKPGAIDGTKPASIEVKKTLENTQITAEFPSKEMSEVCTYNGTEIPAKEVECIIIYDEETGQYSLEKLDSVVSLQFGGKRAAAAPAAPSVPSPATASTSSTPLANTKRKARTAEDDDELEQLSLAAGEDNNNSSSNSNNNNNNSAHKRAAAINLRREEEEEEEGEDTDIPLRLQVQVPKRAPPSKTTTTTTTTTTTPNRTTKPTTTTTPNVKAAIVNTSQLPPSSSILAKSKPVQSSSSSSAVPAVPKAPKPTPKQTKKPKAAPLPTAGNNVTTSYADEEIERPAKKPRISSSSTTTATTATAPTTTTTSRPPPPPPPLQAVEPPKPKPSVELSLPGGQSTFVAPPAPLGSNIPPKKATNAPPIISMTIPPGVSANITMEEVLGDEVEAAVEQQQQAEEEDEDEDEDEDWEAVPTSAPLVHPTTTVSQPDSYDDDDDDIFGKQAFGEDEEGQEIDINAFEAELNEQMEQQEEEGEDDDDMEDVMQDVVGGNANRPISLNRLASGIAVGESDDDYSSSETDSD